MPSCFFYSPPSPLPSSLRQLDSWGRRREHAAAGGHRGFHSRTPHAVDAHRTDCPIAQTHTNVTHEITTKHTMMMKKLAVVLALCVALFASSAIAADRQLMQTPTTDASAASSADTTTPTTDATAASSADADTTTPVDDAAAQQAPAQEGGAAPAAPAFPGAAYLGGWYPGYWTNLASQYFEQAIPYDVGAGLVNGNTPFQVPYLPLPGLTGGQGSY